MYVVVYSSNVLNSPFAGGRLASSAALSGDISGDYTCTEEISVPMASPNYDYMNDVDASSLTSPLRYSSTTPRKYGHHGTRQRWHFKY